MKIAKIEVVLTWEDGTINEVARFLPQSTNDALEDFADYWEAKYSDDEIEVENV